MIALRLAIEILEFAAPEMLHTEVFENNSIATQKTNKATKNLYSSQYGFWIQIYSRYCIKKNDDAYAHNSLME